MMRTPSALRSSSGADAVQTPGRSAESQAVIGKVSASAPLDAIVILGHIVRLDARGRLAPCPLARRVETAARLYAQRAGSPPLVIASGGRRWGAAVEADVMAVELRHHGVPASAIVRERSSLSTRDNARFSAGVLARRAIRAAAVVSCGWHLPRAIGLFARAGVEALPVPAGPEPRPSIAERIWRWGREGVLTRLERFDADFDDDLG